MLKTRSRACRLVAYSCLILPVAFYAGVSIRNRQTSSEVKETPFAPVHVSTLELKEASISLLQKEEHALEARKQDIERKIAEL